MKAAGLEWHTAYSDGLNNYQQSQLQQGRACLGISSVMCVAGVSGGNVTRCGTSVLQSETSQYVNRREQ